MSNDKNIHTWLQKISEELASEGENIRELDSYNGNMFIKKKYDVTLKNGEYSLGESIIENCPAIYLFYSKDKIVKIEPSFNDVKYGSKAKHKNKKDSSEHIVYLGKSYTVRERIIEHLASEDSSPYSLKYNHEKRKDVLKNTVLYVFELKNDFAEYKEVILSTIETNLHINCKPMIGSGRV